jgi:protein-disulfide isomerase
MMMMMSGLRVAAVAAVLAFGAALPAAGQGFSDAQRSEIERIIKNYLMQNPEILQEVMGELEKKQQAADAEKNKTAVKDNAQLLFSSSRQVTLGNLQGDVTLVEFFDYRCAYCRRVVSSMRALLDEDRGLRVVFKELPVLGPDSVRAARAALASRKQDRYVPFHFALMAADDLSPAGIRAAAEAVGLDPDQLEADMAAHGVTGAIDANYALANELGIEGTPAFVIGGQLIPGAVEKARLEQLIQEARSG